MNNCTINDVALNIGSGLTPLRSNKEFWNSSDYPWLKTEQLGSFQIYETAEYISKDALEHTTIKLWPPKTISVAMYGEGQTRGKVSIIMKEMTTNQACCNIIVNPEMADYRYIYYWLKSNYEQLRILSSGVRKNLNSDDIKNFPVKLPDLQTQASIADILYALDRKIEFNNHIIDELEQIVKTIYDYWFVQFDFPNDEGKPYRSSGGDMVWNEQLKREIPKGWKVDQIQDVIDVKDGTHDSPKYVEKGYHLITSKHLLKSGLDFESAGLISEDDYISINKRSKVDMGDILLSMIGTVGTVYKVEETDINFAIKNIALYKTSKKARYKNYIYMYLHSIDMKNHMQSELAGSIQKYIGLGSLRCMPFLNNDEIINLYYKKTSEIFNMINVRKRENIEHTKLRDWLLPMLMNGQVKFKSINNIKENYLDTEQVAETQSKYGED